MVMCADPSPEPWNGCKTARRYPDLRALLRDDELAHRMRDYIRDALWKLAQAEKIPIRFE
jgi:hypothetical protein